MKKALLLVLTVGLLVSTLWASVGRVEAGGLITYVDGRFVWGKGIVFLFDGSSYRNKDVKDANIFVGSNYHDLGCTVDKDQERIVCVLGGGLTRYAGQTGIIYLAGQIFYVTIPDKPSLAKSDAAGPLTCAENESMGAWVTFYFDFFGEFQFSFHEFVEGDSLADVEQSVSQMFSEDPFLVDYQVGGFGCFEVSEEEEIPQ